MEKRPTVIIPAYNEEKNIHTTLSSLAGNSSRIFDIVVVCNGCTDQTSNIVKRQFPEVECIEIETASKTLAIRKAESINPGFPRIYLDADIEITNEGIEELIKHTQKNSCLSIPRSKVIYEKSSKFVRLYYDYWYQTTYVINQGYGAGVYAISKSGRSRFKNWPNLISDDGFIRAQFEDSELQIVDQVTVLVKAPKSLIQLIKIKARSKLGGIELRKEIANGKKPAISIKNEQQSNINPGIVSRLNYYLINFVALSIAHWHFKTNKNAWLRDNSNH